MRRPSAVILVAVVAASCGSRERRRPSRDAGAGVIIGGGSGKRTALSPEKEPNDEAGQAQALAAPGGVRGRIDRAADRDVYVLSPGADGLLRARLSAALDADLTLDVEDVTGQVVASSDRGPAGTVEALPNLAVRRATYRLIVREFVKKTAAPRAAASQAYELEVALLPAPAEGEEREPNDDAASANQLVLGGAGRGWVGWRRDLDVWRVPLAGAGEDEALAVDVDGVPGVNLRVAVLDARGDKLLERVGREGEPVALRNVGVRAGDDAAYLAVSAKKSSDEPYVVRVQTVPFELDEESEPNDTPAKAGPLADIPGAESGTRVGYLSRADVDCFALDPAPAARRLSVTVEPPSGVDVELAVVDAAGAAVGAPVNARKAGGAERRDGVPVPAGAQLYVQITTRSGDNATTRYRLRWSAVPDETLLDPGELVRELE